MGDNKYRMIKYLMLWFVSPRTIIKTQNERNQNMLAFLNCNMSRWDNTLHRLFTF